MASPHGAGDKWEPVWEPGGREAEPAQQPSDEILVWDMIAYLVFHRDVTNKEFHRFIHQLTTWGVPSFPYRRPDHLRHMETRGQKWCYVESGPGPAWTGLTYGRGLQERSTKSGMLLFHRR